MIPLCESARLVKDHTIAHHMEGRPRDLVRAGLEGHDLVGPGALPVEEALDPGRVADGEIGRFHERPGQVRVAALGVVRALLLLVGEALRIHATRVGGKVADFGEPADLAGFQHDGQRQNLADARHAEQRLELRRQV